MEIARKLIPLLFALACLSMGVWLLLPLVPSRPVAKENKDLIALQGFLDSAPAGSLNRSILLAAMEAVSDTTGYRAGGGPDVRNDTGTRRDIHYHGRKRLNRAQSGDLHCIGFLFDIYMRANELEAKEKFNSDLYTIGTLTGNRFSDFRRDFYGVDGNQRTFVNAILNISGGTEIRDLHQAKPGDLIQVWRQDVDGSLGSGHAVIYLDIRRGSGETRYLQYIGLQRNGFTINEEPIDIHGSSVSSTRSYVIRPFLPRPLGE